MTAPEKCPQCSVVGVEFCPSVPEIAHFPCGTSGIEARGKFHVLHQSRECLHNVIQDMANELRGTKHYADEHVAAIESERDALRAELAEAKAQLAASVTRDVAIDAACYGMDVALNVMDTCGMGDLIPFAQRSFPGVATLALARAEAEAATNAAKEKHDG